MGFIKPKYGHCETCDKYAILISKKCQYCYPKFRAKVCAERNLKRAEKKGVDLKLMPNQAAETFSSLEWWFKEFSKKMTGKCANCGSKTCKGTKIYKNSCCHIFPKAHFPSVASHPENGVELCFWSPSCHTNMDEQGIEFMIQMNCWEEMVRKFRTFEHLLTQEEKARKFYKEFKKYADQTK